MKIRDVLKVMGISQKILKSQTYIKKEKYTSFIYQIGKQYCYWTEETIQSAFCFKLYEPRHAEIVKILKEEYGLEEPDPRRLEKYVIVYEVLQTVSKCQETELTLELMESHVKSIENEILASLDFSNIESMPQLSPFVTQNSMLRELNFTVRLIPYTLEDRWKCKKKEQTVYTFGNKQYIEAMDFFEIELLEDADQFMYIREAETHIYPLTDKSLSIEERVLGVFKHFLEEYPLEDSIKKRIWKNYRDITLPYTITRNDDEYWKAVDYWGDKRVKDYPGYKIITRKDDF